jgi:hypothetical protein
MESERKDDRAEDAVDDLDVPEAERDDLKGGALNAYITKATGEKQGQIKGSVTQK